MNGVAVGSEEARQTVRETLQELKLNRVVRVTAEEFVSDEGQVMTISIRGQDQSADMDFDLVGDIGWSPLQLESYRARQFGLVPRPRTAKLSTDFDLVPLDATVFSRLYDGVEIIELGDFGIVVFQLFKDGELVRMSYAVTTRFFEIDFLDDPSVRAVMGQPVHADVLSAENGGESSQSRVPRPGDIHMRICQFLLDVCVNEDINIDTRIYACDVYLRNC